MFEVGDRLLCVDGWHQLHNKEVTVLHCWFGSTGSWFVDVQTDNGLVIKTLLHSRFIKVNGHNGSSQVIRKIRSMYARQYRKTKLYCFL